jgi:citrate synthase
MEPRSYLSAKEAATRLSINVRTLYAYVSRGVVRSVPGDDPHRRLYRAEDVEALVARKKLGKRPLKIAESALNWGFPALESEISTISDGRLLYRGRDATEIAESSTLEGAAQLLWGCASANPFDMPQKLPIRPLWKSISRALAGAPSISRCTSLLNAILPDMRPIWGRQSSAIFPEAAQLLRLVAAGLLGKQPCGEPVHVQFANAWKLNARAADLTRTAMVLAADHELNASTFTVRVIASTGASLAACITGGLASLSGPRHGGAILQVEAFLARMPSVSSSAPLFRAMLARGEVLPGFGHRLYPHGDPRAKALLALLPADKKLEKTVRAVEQVCGLHPTIDFALLALTRSLGLTAEAAISIFAAGRTAAGWIAHALEQNEQGQLIRPRARYRSSGF